MRSGCCVLSKLQRCAMILGCNSATLVTVHIRFARHEDLRADDVERVVVRYNGALGPGVVNVNSRKHFARGLRDCERTDPAEKRRREGGGFEKGTTYTGWTRTQDGDSSETPRRRPAAGREMRALHCSLRAAAVACPSYTHKTHGRNLIILRGMTDARQQPST